MELSSLRTPQYLFSKGSLRDYLDVQLQALKKEIDTLTPDAILNTNIDEFIIYATQNYQLTTPTLREAEITVDEHETQVDISGDPTRLAHILRPNQPTFITGTRITYYIPFDGDAVLFQHRTSTFASNTPEGQISGNTLNVNYIDTNHDGSTITARFHQDLATIKQWLQWVQNDVYQYNDQVPSIARSRFTERREKITKDKALVNNLGYPLRQRAGAHNTYPVPVIRK